MLRVSIAANRIAGGGEDPVPTVPTVVTHATSLSAEIIALSTSRRKSPRYRQSFAMKSLRSLVILNPFS